MLVLGPYVWRDMAGQYTITNPDPHMTPDNIRLRVTDKALILSGEGNLPDQDSFQLCFQAISPVCAEIMGVERIAGKLMRIIDLGGEPGLYYSGFRLKKNLSIDQLRLHAHLVWSQIGS